MGEIGDFLISGGFFFQISLSKASVRSTLERTLKRPDSAKREKYDCPPQPFLDFEISFQGAEISCGSLGDQEKERPVNRVSGQHV